MVRIEILGDVIPAARPRFSGKRCYQPSRNVEYRQKVQAAARLAMDGAEPMDGELFADVKLYRKYKRAARIFGDVDNHLKALFDGLSGIIFCDERSNMPVRGRKVYRQSKAASGDRNWRTGRD